MFISEVKQSPVHMPKGIQSLYEQVALFTKLLFYTAKFHTLGERDILISFSDPTNVS